MESNKREFLSGWVNKPVSNVLLLSRHQESDDPFYKHFLKIYIYNFIYILYIQFLYRQYPQTS